MNILLFTFSLLFGFQVSSNDTTIVQSEIEQVTVFQYQAQIQRKAEVDLESGVTTMVFTGLTETLIDQSVQLRGSGSFTLLSLTTKSNFTKKTVYREDIKALQNKKSQLQRQISEKQASLEVIQNEISMLASTQEIIKNNKLTPTEINELIELYRTNLTKALNLRISESNLLNELRTELDQINRQINESVGIERTSFKEVIAEIILDNSQEIIFELDYQVQNSGWIPVYDIRSEGVNSPLSISYKAKIFQNTGIDWENVKFIINSGNPSSNSVKPILNANYVGYYSQVRTPRKDLSNVRIQTTSETGIIRGKVIDGETRESIPGATILIRGTNVGAASKSDGSFQLPFLNNGSYMLDIQFIGYATLTVPVLIQNNGLFLELPLKMGAVGLEELVVSGYSVSPMSESDDPFSVQIRGNGSINASTEPLYIVNGVRVKKGSISPLENISPEDIESIEVLNDKTATNLYGAEANDGVVVITTKNFASINETNNQTSFSYELELPYSVPSDGNFHTTVIKKETIPVNYLYSTVPKLSQNAYLVGYINDWSSLNFITGESGIYFENRFIGNTLLNPLSFSDSLEISLGKDEQIIVEREQLKEFSSKNFFRNRTRENLLFEISIRNNKSETIAIKVEDQIPVSSNEEIKVSVKELSEGKLDEETGIITWELNINPGETRRIRFGFELEYPKGKRVIY